MTGKQSNFGTTVISPVTGGYQKMWDESQELMLLPLTSSRLMGMMMSTALVKMNRILLNFKWWNFSFAGLRRNAQVGVIYGSDEWFLWLHKICFYISKISILLLRAANAVLLKTRPTSSFSYSFPRKSTFTNSNICAEHEARKLK